METPNPIRPSKKEKNIKTVSLVFWLNQWVPDQELKNLVSIIHFLPEDRIQFTYLQDGDNNICGNYFEESAEDGKKGTQYVDPANSLSGRRITINIISFTYMEGKYSFLSM